MPTLLITGTSSGIGLAATVLLASRGFRVFAGMRDPSKRAALDAALAAGDGSLASRVEVVRLDLNDRTSIEDAARHVLASTGGSLDALVHNAGVSAAGALEDIPFPEIRRVMETNLFGPIWLTQALLPALRAGPNGRIVLVSSEAAFFGQPANSIYAASKWALEGVAESIAYELAPFNIDIVMIEPGPYRTEIWHSTPRYMPEGSPYRAFTRALSRAADKHAAHMARDPQEVAEAILTALTAKCPKMRYAVGPFAKMGHVLRGKIPARVMRRGVRRYLGI